MLDVVGERKIMLETIIMVGVLIIISKVKWAVSGLTTEVLQVKSVVITTNLIS